MSEQTVYQAVGGLDTFVALVESFYRGVAQDPVLAPMYPPDLGPSSRHLAWFLAQYFGGPRTYSDQRGHPALRMRHAPFRLDEDAQRRWLSHMRAALDDLDLPEDAAAEIWSYLERTAHFLRNVPDETTGAGELPVLPA